MAHIVPFVAQLFITISGEAEIYLFGELLNEFFAMYADLNLFTRFSIVSLPSGKTYTWKDSKTTITRF